MFHGIQKKKSLRNFALTRSLMKFGGYSLGEDVDFSYRIFTKSIPALFILQTVDMLSTMRHQAETEPKEKRCRSTPLLHMVLASYVSGVKKFVLPCCLWACLGEILFMLAMNVLLRKEISFAVFIQGVKDAFRAAKRHQNKTDNGQSKQNGYK